MTMSYSIYYHVGDEMDLKSEVHAGEFHLDEEGFRIESENGPAFEASYKEVVGSPQYFRLHFLCRMLEIDSRKGRVFLTTPLVALFDRPIVTNFVQLMDLQKRLNPLVRRAWVRPGTYLVNG